MQNWVRQSVGSSALAKEISLQVRIFLKILSKLRKIAEKFVPFKTPLCDLYDPYVSEVYRFYPKMILRAFNIEAVGKIGLWIDLTNTDRFYDKKEIEDQNIRYVKLNCKGLVILNLKNKLIFLIYKMVPDMARRRRRASLTSLCASVRSSCRSDLVTSLACTARTALTARAILSAPISSLLTTGSALFFPKHKFSSKASFLVPKPLCWHSPLRVRRASTSRTT